MKVELIAVTKPVIPACETAESLLAYCARVSNPSNQTNTMTASRLLKYLVTHKHWSPFEMASMTLEITTTRDIARQMLRHRSFSFQEFSQRYAEATEEAVLREARLQDTHNRQASLPTDNQSLTEWWRDQQALCSEMAFLTYRQALSAGIAKEVARSVLPEGMTVSRLYMAGTIRSWIHYCQLRTEASTQKEHRQVAEACQHILLEQFPSLSEILA